MIRRRAALLIAAGAVAVSAFSPAPAADIPFVAVPGAYINPAGTFGSPVAVVTVGGGITFANLDIQRHDFVADDVYRPDGSAAWCDESNLGRCPLFWTRLLSIGQSTPVLGLDLVESGKTYPFYCTIHPWMLGKLAAV